MGLRVNSWGSVGRVNSRVGLDREGLGVWDGYENFESPPQELVGNHGKRSEVHPCSLTLHLPAPAHQLPQLFTCPPATPAHLPILTCLLAHLPAPAHPHLWASQPTQLESPSTVNVKRPGFSLSRNIKLPSLILLIPVSPISRFTIPRISDKDSDSDPTGDVTPFPR